MKEVRSLVVAGGGTGGHLFPGLAIAEEFRRRRADMRTMYIGVKGKIEEKAVPAAGLQFHGLQVSGLRGSGLRAAARGIFLAARALFECRRVLSAFGPDLMVGVGGYSSGPAALAAWSLRIPLVLQEQNTVPGTTNRLLGRLAGRIFLAFENAAAHFPRSRTVVTGNPIRDEALGEPTEVGRQRVLNILVLGGSRGARGINRIVTEALPVLREEDCPVRFLHQSGEEDVEWVAEAYARAGFAAEVRSFLEGMGDRYSWADLVVSRAGAGAVSEIAAAGRPAVFVPYPFAAAGHQRENARWLQERGGAEIVEESDAGAAGALAGLIVKLSQERAELRRMAARSLRAGRRDAAARIVDECQKFLNRQGG